MRSVFSKFYYKGLINEIKNQQTNVVNPEPQAVQENYNIPQQVQEQKQVEQPPQIEEQPKIEQPIVDQPQVVQPPIAEQPKME